MQVNKKVKEIPKVLLGRSQVQVLVFMLWLTLCSFNFKNLTKISISLLSRLMIRIIEDYFYKIGLKKVTFPSDPKIQRMKEKFELEGWRKNPAHRNVKSIKSGLPDYSNRYLDKRMGSLVSVNLNRRCPLKKQSKKLNVSELGTPKIAMLTFAKK